MFMGDRMKRTGTLLLIITFVLVILLSTAFIFTHADHEHDHNGSEGTCATCAQLYTAQNLLKNLTAVILVLAAALNAFLVLGVIVRALSCKLGIHTLVSLKARLDN